jgi:hypothetical protein
VSVVLAPAPGSDTVQRRAIDDFKPLRIRSLLATRWLSFNVMILLVSLALAVWHLTLLRDDGSNFNAVAASSDRIALAALILIIVYLIGAVIFLFWFHRAYANLDALGARRRHGKGWSIGGWFVPILNLFRPKQIVNDIWRGSSEAEDWRIPRWRSSPESSRSSL